MSLSAPGRGDGSEPCCCKYEDSRFDLERAISASLGCGPPHHLVRCGLRHLPRRDRRRDRRDGIRKRRTLARTILGTLAPTAGSIRFAGRDLVGLSKAELRGFRRSGALQLILQDPLRSLDPDFTVEQIVGEGLSLRGHIGADQVREARSQSASHSSGTSIPS